MFRQRNLSSSTRRRHNSLFQRMQTEIQKIQKKLFAVKQLRQQNERVSPQPTIEKNQQSMNNSNQFQMNLTARKRKKNSNNFINSMTDETLNLKKQQNIEKIQHSGKDNSLVLKLIQDNSQLSIYLGKLQAKQQQQRYRYGFLQAYYKDQIKNMEIQKYQSLKQNIYFEKLLQHYREKALKCKKIIEESDQNFS